MSAAILDGKTVAAKVLAEVRAGVATLRGATGAGPTLAVILVGDDPASQIYVRNKKRTADDVGIGSRDFLFPAGCTQAELLDTLRGVNADPAVHGILLQLPLPPGLDEAEAIGAIAPVKDVDGLTPVSLGRLLAGAPGLCRAHRPGASRSWIITGSPWPGQRQWWWAARDWWASRSPSSSSAATPP